MRVLIAEDHVLFRDALENLLKQIDGNTEVVGATKYFEAFSALDGGEAFDLIILDLDLPDRNWEDGLSKLRDKSGETKIIVITASEDCQSIRSAAAYGISAYIPKSMPPKVLHSAIKIVLDGGTYAPMQAVTCAQEYKNSPTNQPNEELAQKMLTNRQMQVLKQIAEGKPNKQIAYEMSVSEATVKLHINALLRVLNARNRTQAVITAQKLGII